MLALTYDGVLLSVCLFAAIRGGRPERWGAFINLSGSIVSSAVRLLGITSWAPAGVLMLVIDLGVVGGFFWLAVRTIRFWPVWAFGFALADIFISVAGALLPHVALFAFTTGIGLYAYLALGALALGTLRLPRGASPMLRNGFRRQWLPSRDPIAD